MPVLTNEGDEGPNTYCRPYTLPSTFSVYQTTVLIHTPHQPSPNYPLYTSVNILNPLNYHPYTFPHIPPIPMPLHNPAVHYFVLYIAQLSSYTPLSLNGHRIIKGSFLWFLKLSTTYFIVVHLCTYSLVHVHVAILLYVRYICYVQAWWLNGYLLSYGTLGIREVFSARKTFAPFFLTRMTLSRGLPTCFRGASCQFVGGVESCTRIGTTPPRHKRHLRKIVYTTKLIVKRFSTAKRPNLLVKLIADQ